MRKFAYVHPDGIVRHKSVGLAPSVAKGNPCFVPPIYGDVLAEECVDVDGNKYTSYKDLTHILLYQEKYRNVLGPQIMADIIKDLHPKANTLRDQMSDEELFRSVVPRYCQSLSERREILRQISEEHAELKEYAESMLKEMQQGNASSAPAAVE